MKTQKFKRAWIVTIGNELTTGLVADINASVSARFLLKRGYDVARIVSVPDTERAITSVVGEALRKSDFVIITGGLGPTHDDVTKNALCKFFKCKTRFNPSVLRQVQGMFKKFGKKTPEINRSYADVPTAAIAVRNGAGIAPGLLFKNRVLVLPGVPHEARHMLETSALRLVPFGGMHAADKIFRTAGASETRLSDGMKGLSSALKIVEVAFLPSLGNVDVRIISRDADPQKARAKLRTAEKLLRKDIEKHLWGVDAQTIEGVVGALLKKKRKTVAVAESCTGGWVGKKLTSVAGSSDYFLGGVVAYSNPAKSGLLGVPKKIIQKFGAVSSETAAEMARGARKKLGADYGLSTTGVAGPGGGTKEKPAGLVYIAVSSVKGEIVRRLMFGGEREVIRERSSFEALFLLFQSLTVDERGR